MTLRERQSVPRQLQILLSGKQILGYLADISKVNHALRHTLGV